MIFDRKIRILKKFNHQNHNMMVNSHLIKKLPKKQKKELISSKGQALSLRIIEEWISHKKDQNNILA